MPESESIQPVRFSRTLQLALFVTALAGYFASDVVACPGCPWNRTALRLLAEEPLLARSSSFSAGAGLFDVAGPAPSARFIARGARSSAAGYQSGRVGRRCGYRLGKYCARRPAHGPGPHVTGPFMDRTACLLATIRQSRYPGSCRTRRGSSLSGYPFRRLIAAIGPVMATIAMSVLFGLLHALNPEATLVSVLVTMLAGVFLSLAWLRTHGLWLPWGLHFAWNASMGVLFGLPVSGITRFSSVVETRAIGRYGSQVEATDRKVDSSQRWPSGRHCFPGTSHQRLRVELHPPAHRRRRLSDGHRSSAAHVAMEQEAKAPSLVQILPTTPQSRLSTTSNGKSWSLNLVKSF